MGEVFLAEDPTLRRGVAIKRIRPTLQRDRVFRARLRREAQLAAQLSHRAIVQVFDLITEDNVDHLVMEYVAGPSLHALLAGRPTPVAEAVRIAGELADGLVYAHGRGIVHRDLKLENVLINSDGQPKIVDFGIARRTPLAGDGPHESLTRDGVMIGTSRAMSPEQIQCREVDARSDLFSFGVLLYEMLTGTSPFASGNAALTMVRVLSDRQAAVRALVPAIPPALSELVDQLLEKEPALRPDSARTVRDRLARVFDGAPPRRESAPEATPPPAPGRLAPRRRFPGVAAAGTRENALAFSPRDVALVGGDHHAPRKATASRIQAPFVLAEIRALRSSVFKRSPEIQNALAIADKVETAYDLSRSDLFIPAGDTWCAILEPFAMSVLTGTLRRIGYEIFPQYVQILGIAAPDVRTAMDLRGPADLVRVICDAYSKCVVGSDAGTLTPRIEPGKAVVTDTTFIPCQLQMGVFLGAGQLTGLFRDSALTEKQCRGRGDPVCVYEFAF
jgi:serine/threonine protein kinase